METMTDIRKAKPMQLLISLMSSAEKIDILLTINKKNKNIVRISGKKIIFLMLILFIFCI
jgi:hypothetical protein